MYVLPVWNGLENDELFNSTSTLKGKQNETLDWRFQLEFGDENGVPHYQAYAELKYLSHISDVRRVINDSFDTFNSVEIVYNKYNKGGRWHWWMMNIVRSQLNI